uniref:Uncharacterized protein n=1 Tax=Populus alba TaxID=43335 RepID=A0A4U5QX75_POPAL|nr:uncharacterized protein D5086_0000028980 [Populus alba]
MEKPITIEKFLTKSELNQHDEGNCSPLEFESQLPEHVKLDDMPLEDKKRQDVSMKRWVGRASKAKEMVDHLLSIEQTLSSEKENAEREAECWASEAMRYHVQADDAKNYALGLRGIAQQIADGEPMTRNEFHQFFGLIRDEINEISAYDGPRLWKD